jgi:hypothetical protein
MKEKVIASFDLVEREIKTRYGCRGVPVKKEIVKADTGESLLNFAVTKFELIAHESAKYCYAWLMPSNGREKVVTMLEIAPILSAQEAVWARLNYQNGK